MKEGRGTKLISGIFEDFLEIDSYVSQFASSKN